MTGVMQGPVKTAERSFVGADHAGFMRRKQSPHVTFARQVQMEKPMRALAFVVALLPLSADADTPQVQPMTDREGWRVIDTPKPYAEMIDALKAATKANKMGVVTEAGPTDAAKALGITLPGNWVIGVFAPQFAVRVLPLSTAAMIEAPIRFYVTEDADGSSTLAWKTPSFVFAPYVAEAGPELAAIAAELDARFEAIATDATAK
jgi:uncharacterized protein (DUF302 family)